MESIKKHKKLTLIVTVVLVIAVIALALGLELEKEKEKPAEVSIFYVNPNTGKKVTKQDTQISVKYTGQPVDLKIGVKLNKPVRGFYLGDVSVEEKFQEYIKLKEYAYPSEIGEYKLKFSIFSHHDYDRLSIDNSRYTVTLTIVE